MTLAFCHKALCTKACFGCWMCSDSGNRLSNKVGSTDRLVETGKDDQSSYHGPSIKLDELRNGTPYPNNQSNLMNGWKSHDDGLEADGDNGVIVKQPVNRIKIVNVTYQKHYTKTNKVNNKRISVAANGHVKTNSNPPDTSSVETISGGNISIHIYIYIYYFFLLYIYIYNSAWFLNII